MNKIVNIIFALAAVAAVIIVGFFAFSYLGLKKQEINNEARFQCAQSYRYQSNDGKAVVSYPATDLYNSCLKEKGL